jgi:hypothetical protein
MKPGIYLFDLDGILVQELSSEVLSLFPPVLEKGFAVYLGKAAVVFNVGPVQTALVLLPKHQNGNLGANRVNSRLKPSWSGPQDNEVISACSHGSPPLLSPSHFEDWDRIVYKGSRYTAQG